MRAHRNLGAEISYFDPWFCSYLRQMSGDRAENFTTVSPLQPQHMLQISAHLYRPGTRSIFEGGGGFNKKIIGCFLQHPQIYRQLGCCLNLLF